MIQLLQGDCMDLMRNTPDKFYDLAIVDPPYGIGEDGGHQGSRNNGRIDKRTGKKIVVKHAGYIRKEWDKKRPSELYFRELLRVSGTAIIWGGNYFADLLAPSPAWIVWDKVNGDSDFSDCELAWTNHDSRSVRQIEYMWSGFLQGVSIGQGRVSQGDQRLCEKRIHPTQKPVKLYKWLLHNYAQPGDKILDTHLGSGSSAIAAHDMGFNFTGIELDADYYAAAMKRYNNHTLQSKLF